MQSLKSIKKSTFLIVISITCAITLISSLLIFTTFLKKSLAIKSLTSEVEKAYRYSILDSATTFERALKYMVSDTEFGLFKQSCEAIFVKDLGLNHQACLEENKNYTWEFIYLGDERYKLALNNEIKLDTILNENLKLVKISFVVSMLLFLILSILLFKMFISIPSTIVANEIDSFLLDKEQVRISFPSDNTLIFSSFYKSLNRLLQEVKLYFQENTRLQIARQIVHDLQVPIAIIKSELENDNIPNKESISNASLRLEKIVASLRPAKANNDNFINLSTIESELKSLANAYSVEFNCKFNFDHTVKLKANIHENDLYRILSNLLKNSAEANALNINLTINVSSNLDFIFQDDGKGIPQDKLSKIFNSEYTDKPNGSGLGLSFTKAQIRKSNGYFNIFNNQDTGLTISFGIPLLLNPALVERIILIDDDKYIGLMWKKNCELKNIPFAYLKDFDTETIERLNIKFSDHIFIDFNLEHKNGNQIAEYLYLRGYKNLYMASGDLDIELPSYFISNVGKAFPL